MTGNEVIRSMPMKRRRMTKKMLDRNARRRVTGIATHDAIHPIDVAMMYRFMAMEPENVRAYLKECEEVAAARERKGLDEKVTSWRKSLAPLTNNTAHNYGAASNKSNDGC